MKQTAPNHIGRLAATLSAVAIIGCAQPAAEPEQEAQKPEVAMSVTPQPQLATARDHQITLFGELPGRPGVPYFTRSATGLLQHTFSNEGADFDPYVSRDGKWLAFASTRHSASPNLYYKAVDGMAVTQLTADPAADVQPVFSPNRTHVAFASNRTGNWDIWIVGIDGQQPEQITSGLSQDIHPSWSSDGSRLVYSSLSAHGQWEIWVADAKADGTKQFIGYGLFPEWSPTGNTILFQRARERGSRWFSIWTLDLVNGEPRHPTEIAYSADASLITPTWSPDGTHIAYTAVTPDADSDPFAPVPDNRADVWVVDAEGRSRVRLTDGYTANFTPMWSSSGRIFFTSSREGMESIWSLQPLIGEAEGSATAYGAGPVSQSFEPAGG